MFAEADGTLRGRVTRDSLQSVLDHFTESRWPAQHLQVTGDIVQDDSRMAYQRFCDMLAPIGLPVYCVPGNHDIRPLMQEALRQSRFHYCGTLETHNWLIAGIDSCIEGSAGGRVEESELDRLDQLIEATQAQHAMVCLHHPPLPVGSRWLDELAIENRAEVLRRVCASGKVRLMIFGHVHQEFDDTYGPVRVIGTPSTCRQFARDSDTFALDDQPPAYRRIELHSDGSIDTELIWI